MNGDYISAPSGSFERIVDSRGAFNPMPDFHLKAWLNISIRRTDKSDQPPVSSDSSYNKFTEIAGSHDFLKQLALCGNFRHLTI